ncbi:MAG: nucleotide sugar dehydrogenase [Methanospirillaceae archaeon]|nr:nucleotide sugar dehydrogenase [Methanospirillaceae archaeon]
MTQNLQDTVERRGPIRVIGVIGMGYVGIPSALLFADVPAYTKVYGFQRDSPGSGYKIEMLNQGISPLKGKEPGLSDLLSRVVSLGKFECTSDFSRLRECDAITLAIQTPFLDHRDLVPDFSALFEGIRVAGRYLTPGTLVVLESTITPGTTTGVARTILFEESGLTAGEDFCLAHAPERVMVGRLLANIREHDRIVGGIDPVSTRRAIELYSPVLSTGSIIPMSATAAEVTKTAENTLRDLQIAAANQLALYCEAMGINFYDVRAGVDSLKGEGITRAMLWPGAGVGGHCLTKDTYHLERGVVSAPVAGLDYPQGKESLYTLARDINDFMPKHMVFLTRQGLARAEKTLQGAVIALLGWAFLPDTDDARNTPAEEYYRLCDEAGAEVRVHDPLVFHYPGVIINRDINAVLQNADAVVLFTSHGMYRSLSPDYVLERVSKNPVLVDGRNVFDPDTLIDAGFIYKGIGRGDKNYHQLTKS